jgi:hypothetical protein
MPPAPLFPAPSAASDRRAFLKMLGFGGVALGAAATLAACDSTSVDPDADPQAVTLDFSADTGVLNYALVLEQLEAAFYAALVADAQFTTTFSADEQRLIRDLGAHEAIHRDFLQAALGNAAIPELTFDFSSVNVRNRQQVLTVARDVEDLGVAAYNGAGRYLRDPGLLTVAGKIVSVEARHAAAIASVLAGGSRLGADGVIDAQGLDRALSPNAVAQAAAPFIRNSITIRNA